MKEQGTTTSKGNVGTKYKSTVSVRSDKVKVPGCTKKNYKDSKKA